MQLLKTFLFNLMLLRDDWEETSDYNLDCFRSEQIFLANVKKKNSTLFLH